MDASKLLKRVIIYLSMLFIIIKAKRLLYLKRTEMKRQSLGVILGEMNSAPYSCS